jgi:hypothetical protein
LNKLLAKLRAIFRGPMAAPPTQLEAKNDDGVSPQRLDAALERLRAENPQADDDSHEL